ncbi:DUF4157 domain-containing protein [Anabaena sp. CCY 9402-a]|uniref:eCIS core domain-containing protein n=1 Tax=Anabaena sp. CCY 9402-a TaxID=3103867 RepID=UPI0039C725F8
MRTHKASQKQSLASNSLVSRPFAVQAKPEESTELPGMQGYASQIPEFAIFNPAGDQAPVQPKLAIGSPGDKYEQEADRMAKQVVQQMNAPQSLALQPQEMPEEEKELQKKPRLQMQPTLQLHLSQGGMTASPKLESAIQKSRGTGQPLAEHIQQPMEQAFGTDFSLVKVHTDSQSDQLNQSLQAKAFTTGQDIFFRQGAYQPSTQGGQELIAHELTHVVQQNHHTVNRQLIQRAVGFEFEFGEWKSYKNDDKKSRLNKGEEIISGNGYKIEGEDTYDAQVSAVEVVTKPYTTQQEALESVTEAQGKMQSMFKDGEKAGHLANKYGGKADVFVEPHGTSGKIQASAAIALDKLANLYSIQSAKGGGGKGLGATVTTKLQNKDLKDKYLDGQDASPELIGFATLILDYIEQGSSKGTLSYPKSAFKLMARTSFDKMFSLVPEYSFFSQESNINKWAGLILEIAASLGFSKKKEQETFTVNVEENVEVEEDRMFELMTSVFGKKKVTKKVIKELVLKKDVYVNKTAEELAEEPIINQVLMGMELLPEDSDDDQQSYKLKIKRIEWLKGMLKGDLISKATDKRFEGMGSYGDSTDIQVMPEEIEDVTEKAVSKAVDKLDLDKEVNEDEEVSKPISQSPKEAPIFELRGMKDMFAIQQDVNLTDWTEKVKEVFKVIEEANQGESFAPGGKPNIPEDVDNPDIWDKV